MMLKVISPLTLSVAALTFGLGVALCAPAFGEPTERRLKPSERVARIFERLDTDESDQISRLEAEDSKLKRRFERIDADKNGYVSRKELLKAVKQRGHKRRPRRRE